MVCELIDGQFPSWRHLTIEAVESAGTVNAVLRIGGRFATRFPLRPGMPPRCGGGNPSRQLGWVRLYVG